MLLIPPNWKASAERRDTPAYSEVGVLGKHVVSSRLLGCVAAASGRMRQNRGTAAVAIYRADVGNSRMRGEVGMDGRDARGGAVLCSQQRPTKLYRCTAFLKRARWEHEAALEHMH